MALTITAPIATRGREVQAWLSRLVARASATTRLARARAGYAAGMLCSAWGVGVLWGLGWALLVGGIVCSWSFLHLYPVDEP